MGQGQLGERRACSEGLSTDARLYRKPPSCVSLLATKENLQAYKDFAKIQNEQIRAN
jgi:hypothetical protein